MESLVTSKDAKIQELKGQIDDQKQEMNHSSSHQSSLGGHRIFVHKTNFCPCVKSKFGI